MSDFQLDIIGEVLRLEAELVRLAAEHDAHPPDSAEFERLDGEWGDVHRGWHGQQETLSVEEELALEVRRHGWQMSRRSRQVRPGGGNVV